MKVLNIHKVGKNVPGAALIMRPSKYGNPIRLGADGNREDVLVQYRTWLTGQPDLIEDMRRELAGKDLLCCCAPRLCHGHVMRDVIMAPGLVADGYAEHPSQIRVYDAAEGAVFSKASEAHGLFGNMSGGFPLVIDDLEIPSTESLYQALRFPDHPEVQSEILSQKNGFLAKKAAYQHIDKSRADWFSVNMHIMRFVLQVKLCEHHGPISEALGKTRGLPIVERSNKDAFWGAKPYRDGLLVGQNILGRLWMEIRMKLGDDPGFCRAGVTAPDVPDLRLNGRVLTGYECRNTPRNVQAAFEL